jgi:hypothetical protein
MNERDELAKAVFVADNYNATDDVTLSDWEALVESDGDASYAHRIAQGLIQAGYRRPRTITTVEELNALPAGSILLSQSEYPRYAGTVWRVSSERMIEKVGREVEGVTPSRYFKDPLPATVLHIGGAE